MKFVKEYKGPTWEQYRKNHNKRMQDAAQQIKDNLHDDSWWNLLKQRLENRDNALYELIDRYRKKLIRGDKSGSSILRVAYVMGSVFICDDGCEYNLKPRRGERKYTTPKKFYCALAVPSDKNINDFVCKSTPPSSLDVDKNICSKFYIDLSGP